MQLPHPSTYHDDLTDDRLSAIASRLLEVRHETLKQLSTDLDDAYVRETAVFGRTRLMLIGMALNNQFPWLNLSSPTMDVTGRIGDVPFRYFRDDPDSPGKSGFFKRNAVDDLFPVSDQHPMMWRFVVERAEAEEQEDQVHFIGYNAFAEKVSQWTYAGHAASRLTSVDRDVPAAKVLPMPEVSLLPDVDSRQGDTPAKSAG
jgi:hypothetical protein